MVTKNVSTKYFKFRRLNNIYTASRPYRTSRLWNTKIRCNMCMLYFEPFFFTFTQSKHLALTNWTCLTKINYVCCLVGVVPSTMLSNFKSLCKKFCLCIHCSPLQTSVRILVHCLLDSVMFGISFCKSVTV